MKGELVLVLGLLVSARCEVRARDPEEEELAGLGPPHPGGTPQKGNYRARQGNWCLFVFTHVQPMEVADGGERHHQRIRSKSSPRPVDRQKEKVVTSLGWDCCPGHRGRDCDETASGRHRPVSAGPEPKRIRVRAPELQARRQQQQQHGDPNREQNDFHGFSNVYNTFYPHNQPALDAGGNPHLNAQAAFSTYPHNYQHVQHQQLPGVDEEEAAALTNLALLTTPPIQNDPTPPVPNDPTPPIPNDPTPPVPNDPTPPVPNDPTPPIPNDPTPPVPNDPTLPVPNDPTPPVPNDPTPPIPNKPTHPVYNDPSPPIPNDPTPPVPNDPTPPIPNDSTPPVPFNPTHPDPHLVALVMSQLKPLLDGFSHSLENLDLQVGGLARDVARLQKRDDEAEEDLEAKLDEVLQQVGGVRRQMEVQRSDVEDRLHSQHAMLHYNLTSFKTDVDVNLKRNQQMLQVSLQAVNATLAELKSDQDQLPEDEPEKQRPTRPPPPAPSDTSALWEAIARLDNMVVNNTVKVDGLMADMELRPGEVQLLWQHLQHLERQTNQTARNSQILFMETGLEVEDSKVTVLRRLEELALNLTQHKQSLLDTESDVDYLFKAIYELNASADCDCRDLRVAVVTLERGVANATELARENRLTLDDISEGGPWGGASEWEPAVEELRRRLQQVEESLSSERSRTRTLEQNLAQMGGSLAALQDTDTELKADTRILSESFRALLRDAVRHSEVLQLLMGEEVLEFLEWPPQDQEAHSIPALKEQVQILQEQLRGHGVMVEVPSADQPPPPPDWLPGAMRSGEGPARERQLLRPEARQHAGDGGDLWNLEKLVEKLEQKLIQLEETPCSCNNPPAQPGAPPTELQEEVMWLKRGLQEHLRMFKNVFSNADVLAESDATLELDKLWQLVKKRGGGGGGGQRRSSREAPGLNVPFSQSDGSLLFVAGSPRLVSGGAVAFTPSLNRGRFYSNAGIFTAPDDGIYLFILTLDLRPGPAHVVLRRGGDGGGAPVSLQRREVMEGGPVTGVSLQLLKEGQEVGLELRGGEWAESEDNMLIGLLLHQNT